MYIPEFVCGMIAGAALELVVLITLALWTGRDKKKK